jgi:hypothetical protein
MTKGQRDEFSEVGQPPIPVLWSSNQNCFQHELMYSHCGLRVTDLRRRSGCGQIEVEMAAVLLT